GPWESEFSTRRKSGRPYITHLPEYHPSPRISPISPMQHGLSGPGSTGLDKAQRWCGTRPCFDTPVRDNTGDDQGLAPAGIGGASRMSVMVTRRLAAI